MSTCYCTGACQRLGYCPNTGSYPGTVTVPAPVGWRCPNCGSGVAPGFPYCMFCAPKRTDPQAKGNAE